MKPTRHDGFVTDRSAAPQRSLAQRLDALERANLVRTRRAMLKKDLKAGRASIHMLLQQPPDYVATAKVMDMLLAVPLYGRVKVNKVLAQCRISPTKTIGGLSERQRDELVKLIHAPRDAQPAPPPASPAAAHSVPSAQANRDADEALAYSLERLVEEARQVGRLAGRAAGEARGKDHTSAPRPDIVGVRAELRRTLGPAELPREIEDIAQTPLPATVALVPIEPPEDGYLDALRRSNEMRLARAELRRKIADGTLSVSDVILTCPWEAASMTITELLSSQNHWSTTRCSKFLAMIGMAESKTIGSMSERQRTLLATMI